MAAPAVLVAQQLEFQMCLCDVCGLSNGEPAAIENQGYNMARKFRHIKKDSMTDLFSTNTTLKNLRIVCHQNLRMLWVWLQEQDPTLIDLVLFMEDILNLQSDAMTLKER